MAELQASWIAASSHPADTDRLVLEGLLNPPGAAASGAKYGVGSAATELAVTENGTPNMTVNVAAGHAWIDGTENANQGAYHGYNDASKSLTITAAHATLARKDLIVAKVQDAAYSGATNAWSLAVVTGTAAGSPTEPVVPVNAIVLAMIDVPALDTAITNSQITDRRRRASALGGVVVCTSATRPTTPYVGQDIFETDTKRAYFWNGTDWSPHGAGGELGYGANSANQAGITTEVDVTNVAAPVTVATGRKIKVYAELGVGSTVATDVIRLTLKEGGTSLQIRDIVPGITSGTSGNVILAATARLTPSAGAHTYKATLQRLAGSGTLTVAGNATYPSFIQVTDEGPG
jgi:hypothetical protein